MWQYLRHPLESRVGRRIAFVAVLSVLVPLTLFGSVIFARAREQLQRQGRDRLHQDVKTAALAGLARLRILEEELLWFDLTSTALPQPTRPALNEFLERVDVLSVRLGGGVPRLLKGTGPPPDLSAAEARHLQDVGVLLLPGARPLSNWVIVGQRSGWQVAVNLSTAALFGLADVTSRPADQVLCLRRNDAEVVCSDGDSDTAAVLAGAQLPDHAETSLAVGGVTQAVRTWALPLQADFNAGVWTVVLLTPEAAADVTLRQLQRDVTLLAVVSLAVVILAVLASVRSNLRPLIELESAAARLSRQQFDLHVEVATGDEFETLATGFNGMMDAVRTHVEDIQAFSVGAATALARAIDAKSPWTAGHSERVTVLAVDIARTLGLPDADLTVLYRGGLLHDIGKLATPPEILDKPGRLTEHELERIRQHPRDGVRILEPIAHFAPLLPIVLEHHERFDGTGYPDRKAGHAIHPLARVLAVADVYDALVSDRPYRPGLTRAAAIAAIRDASGSHFDPTVVEAFSTVVARVESTLLLESQHATDSARRALGATA